MTLCQYTAIHCICLVSEKKETGAKFEFLKRDSDKNSKRIYTVNKRWRYRQNKLKLKENFILILIKICKKTFYLSYLLIKKIKKVDP